MQPAVTSERVDDSHKYIPLDKRLKGMGCRGSGRNVTPVKGPVAYPEVGHPTSYQPGSGEKLAVMMRRFNRGERLFHPFDCRNPVCVLPLLFSSLETRERERIARGQMLSADELSPVPTGDE